MANASSSGAWYMLSTTPHGMMKPFLLDCEDSYIFLPVALCLGTVYAPHREILAEGQDDQDGHGVYSAIIIEMFLCLFCIDKLCVSLNNAKQMEEMVKDV
jgi:hypothetical protein